LFQFILLNTRAELTLNSSLKTETEIKFCSDPFILFEELR
jgi:hypothetical protein